MDPLPREQVHHSTAAAAWLKHCCQALQGTGSQGVPELGAGGADPTAQLLQWLVAVMSRRSTTAQQQHSGSQASRQQHGASLEGCGGSNDQQLQPLHPAEALRQLLEAAVSALLYRHALNINQ